MSLLVNTTSEATHYLREDRALLALWPASSLVPLRTTGTKQKILFSEPTGMFARGVQRDKVLPRNAARPPKRPAQTHRQRIRRHCEHHTTRPTLIISRFGAKVRRCDLHTTTS